MCSGVSNVTGRETLFRVVNDVEHGRFLFCPVFSPPPFVTLFDGPHGIVSGVKAIFKCPAGALYNIL